MAPGVSGSSPLGRPNVPAGLSRSIRLIGVDWGLTGGSPNRISRQINNAWFFGSSQFRVGSARKRFRHTRLGAAADSFGSSYTRKPSVSRPLDGRTSTYLARDGPVCPSSGFTNVVPLVDGALAEAA